MIEVDIPSDFWPALEAVSTLVAAVGTVAAFGVGFWQLQQERSIRHAKEAQAIAAGRIAQARAISAWQGGELDLDAEWMIDTGRDTPGTILNSSRDPIYRVVVWLVFIQGAGPSTGEEYNELGHAPGQPAVLPIVPPGAYVVPLPGGWRGMMARPGLEVAFNDAAGLHWVRRADGKLEELSRDPLEHYSVGLPVDWEPPDPAI
jgi:hypothetical protein